jgi:hypothetical protein
MPSTLFPRPVGACYVHMGTSATAKKTCSKAVNARLPRLIPLSLACRARVFKNKHLTHTAVRPERRCRGGGPLTGLIRANERTALTLVYFQDTGTLSTVRLRLTCVCVDLFLSGTEIQSLTSRYYYPKVRPTT